MIRFLLPMLVLGCCGAADLAAAMDAGGERPNIIFILADDLGYGDLGCYGGAMAPTPNLDRLAEGGIRFEQFYSASPICSPSRVAFTTGMFPARWKITHYLNTRQGNRDAGQADYLDPKAPSIARLLKAAGYATCHIGKWHMGGGRDVDDAPAIKEYGFDECTSTWESPNPKEDPKELGIEKFRFTQFYVDKSIDYIRRHKGAPFYLQLWPNDTHDPHQPAPRAAAPFSKLPAKQAALAAVLAEYDRQLGRLFDELKQLGLERNTLVVFTSDNGPNPPFDEHVRTAGLRGMKWSLYEGGIRMPLIVRWPANTPSGKVDKTTVACAVDYLPTICALCGAKPPEDAAFDGVNLSAAWTGKPQSRDKPVYWDYGRNKFYLKPTTPADRSPNLAVRDGNWKLLINADGSGAELYDLKADRNEQTNLAEKHSDLTRRLSEDLLRWRRSLP